MKFIPESLEESMDFERGLDPKKAMDIGVNRPLRPGDKVVLLSSFTREPFDTAYYIRTQEDGGIVVTHPHQAEMVMDPDHVVRESINFERGLDPKAAMGIGDAAVLPQMITSDDLEGVSNLDQWDDMVDPDRDDDQIEEDDKRYAYLQRIKRFIKGKVTFGRYFDWKEDQEMEDYINRYARGRYVYTYTPGMDGAGVAFSKIELPNAEEIIQG